MPSEEQYRALEKRISFLERLESGTGLIDYFATSTKVGWSSYTDNILKYKRIGGLLYVFFFVSGTSDNVATTLSLPYTAVEYARSVIWTQDNTVTVAFGSAYVPPAESTLYCYPDAKGTAWTNSNVKAIQGEIIIPI